VRQVLVWRHTALAYGRHALAYGRHALSYDRHALSYGRHALSYGRHALSYGRHALSYGRHALSYGRHALAAGRRRRKRIRCAPTVARQTSSACAVEALRPRGAERIELIEHHLAEGGALDDHLVSLAVDAYARTRGAHGTALVARARELLYTRRYKSADLVYGIALALRDAGRLDEARSEFARAVERSDLADNQLAWLAKQLGIAYDRRRVLAPKTGTTARGNKLVALVVAHAEIARPVPLSTSALAKLKLANSVRRWLAYDATWLRNRIGWPSIRGDARDITLADLARRHYRHDRYRAPLSSLAKRLRAPVLPLDRGSDSFRALYLAPVRGEYPVLFVDDDDGLLVGVELAGFDLWLAVQHGLLAREDARARYPLALAGAPLFATTGAPDDTVWTPLDANGNQLRRAKRH
jgi:hypothetical protein